MLYAQPIVELSTARVTSEVLLIRMVDDDGRVVPSTEVVPAAERRGLMPLIDRHVIERAFTLAATGRRINVNLSATTIRDPRLLADILASAYRCATDPASITFEITETAAAGDMAQARRLARGLVRRGL